MPTVVTALYTMRPMVNSEKNRGRNLFRHMKKRQRTAIIMLKIV